jgi:hypothetical protein
MVVISLSHQLNWGRGGEAQVYNIVLEATTLKLGWAFFPYTFYFIDTYFPQEFLWKAKAWVSITISKLWAIRKNSLLGTTLDNKGPYKAELSTSPNPVTPTAKGFIKCKDLLQKQNWLF